MARIGKEAVAGLILAIVLVSSCWARTPCSESDKLDGICQCLKDPEKSNLASVTCKQIDSKQLTQAFSKLSYNGESYYELQLQGSNLEGLDALPESFHNIIHLMLDGNKGITAHTLQIIIEPLQELHHLMFDNGQVSSISKELLSKNKKLTIVDLNSNQIEKIEDDAFAQLVNLKVLRLKNNKLHNVPKAALLVMALQVLDLIGNPIVKVNEQDARVLKQKNIQLFMDSVECNCDARKSALAEWVRERNLETITCASPEKLQDTQLAQLQAEDVCDMAAPFPQPTWLVLISVCACLHFRNF